jgi:hypothetical protein
MAIWYILWSFGIFFSVLVFCAKKNLANLLHERLTDFFRHLEAGREQKVHLPEKNSSQTEETFVFPSLRSIGFGLVGLVVKPLMTFVTLKVPSNIKPSQ